MIKLQDANHATVAVLTPLKEMRIESALASGDKLLSFKVPKSVIARSALAHELYLVTTTDEYVLKEVNSADNNFFEVFGKLNLDALKGKSLAAFEKSEQDVSTVLTAALVGTGWTLSMIDPATKARTISLTDTSVYNVIMNCCSTYNVEAEFDSATKTVKIYQARGTNRGAYVYSDLNLRDSNLQSDSYNFATRIYPVGKDGLTIASVNAGVEYLDNNQYSSKVIEYRWTDNRYTIPQSLYDDAVVILDKISKPRVAFTVDVINLVNSRPEYSILDFRLGDTVRIFDRGNQVQDTQRIVKLTEYPLTPEKNKVEFANTQLRFSSVSVVEKVDSVAADLEQTASNLRAAVAAVNDLIANGVSGYVYTRYNSAGQPYELLIMDTPDIATAVKVWRWGLTGLAYSSAGYNGTYTTAITQDGQIVADFVTTGVLDAALIKTGLLQSADGSSWLNMTDGTFSLGGGRLAFAADGTLTLNYTGTALATAIASKADQADMTEIKNYIRFDNGDILLGEEGSAVTLKIQNDSIGFFQSDPVNPVAEFTDDTLTVTDANITKSIQIGNFAFVPRANGNLSFMKVVY